MQNRLRDIILITLVVTIVFILGYILTPVMSLLPVAAYRALIMAPIYGAGIIFLLNKVPKFGIVSLTGTLLGLLLSIFSPYMLLIPILSGIITDTCCFMVFRNYSSELSKTVAGAIFPSIHIPITLFLMGLLVGGIYLEALTNPILLVLPTVLTFFIAFYSAKYSLRIFKRRKI